MVLSPQLTNQIISQEKLQTSDAPEKSVTVGPARAKGNNEVQHGRPLWQIDMTVTRRLSGGLQKSVKIIIAQVFTIHIQPTPGDPSPTLPGLLVRTAACWYILHTFGLVRRIRNVSKLCTLPPAFSSRSAAFRTQATHSTSIYFISQLVS